jgi:hypothetical protein
VISGHWINAAAFTSTPCIGGTTPGTCIVGVNGAGTGFGDSGPGIITGPGQFNWDTAIVKNTKLWEHGTLQFRTEFYNIWNHPQFDPPFGNNVSGFSPPFGKITSTSTTPRVIQFGLKYLF